MAATTTAKKRLERCSGVPAVHRYTYPRPEHTPVREQLDLMPTVGRLQVADLLIGPREALS